MNSTSINVCIYLFLSICFQFFSVYTRIKIAVSYYDSLFNFLRNHKLFTTAAWALYIPISNIMWVQFFLQILPTVVIFPLFRSQRGHSDLIIMNAFEQSYIIGKWLYPVFLNIAIICQFRVSLNSVFFSALTDTWTLFSRIKFLFFIFSKSYYIFFHISTIIILCIVVCFYQFEVTILFVSFS